MRIRFVLQPIAALATLIFPVTMLAQFQPPTGEELEMKAEPKAPGAAAIYLYREETMDDNLHFHTYFARIKVLTEKGKELATVSIPYPKSSFSVTDIKGRTIHSDGTIIPLDVKPTDLVEHKSEGFQVNKMVFTLPSVEVGSILEYRWQLRYPDTSFHTPYWDIQQHYFVRKAHYSFLPFKRMGNLVNSRGDFSGRLLYSSLLPKGVTVVNEASGRYTLDVTDVPPIPDEEYMPPLGSWIEQVQFYYSAAHDKEEFWKTEGERWSKEMNRFANETKTLKEAVSTIIAPGDSEDVRARKIYDAVMALDNTDYTRRKSRAELKEMGLKQTKQAEDVWKQKGGSSDEIALLYLAMVRIAGLKAYAATVCNRNREVFNVYFMSMNQFDDVLVLVSINGKEVALDPGKKYATFGQLDWRHTLTGILRQSDKGTILSDTQGNSYKDATTLRVADLAIDKEGKVKGTIRVSMNGPAALHWRDVAIENDEDEVKKRFDETLHGLVPDGIDAELDHFLGLEDYHSTLMAVVKVSGNMGTATGKRVFLPGVFFESRAKHSFVAQDKREMPVNMEYAESIQDEVTYHVPDTFNIESAPVDTSLPWAGHAILKLKTTVDKNDLTVVRNYIRAFVILEPKDYSALRDFYQKIATADQQQLVLTTSPAVKGN